jgi:aconitate hydratase
VIVHNIFNALDRFDAGHGHTGSFYSLPRLEQEGLGRVSRLPVSLRVILESILRNMDGVRVTEGHVRALAKWEANGERVAEIPFVVARVLLQDFTGVPLLVDLAAMRSAASRSGRSPHLVEPLVPVDLVIDHSIQVDFAGSADAFERNIESEFRRNRERYQFLKWGTQAFNGLRVIPPGIGIVHQVNLEYLANGIVEKDGLYYPDSLVGTDSHTTMINGLGILGWGVGGIEAEAAMLGQPIYLLMPDVVGVHMSGALREGVTATDLALHVTQMLRKAKVVGKFVEYFGDGAASLSLPDRATISNMAPEYGATVGYFPVDEESCNYLRATGRPAELIDAFRRYYEAQGMFGIPRKGDCDYSLIVELDLSEVRSSVAGPRRPQDRISVEEIRETFNDLLRKPVTEGGYGKQPRAARRRLRPTTGATPADVIRPGATLAGGGGEQGEETAPIAGHTRDTSALTEREMMDNRPTPNRVDPGSREHSPGVLAEIQHGDVVIAAITSCTNTSNPTVMIGAGILAKKAVERGLTVGPLVKASLAPGSRVVTDYLERSGLQTYLDKLRFNLVGYGCTTCIGNSGPLDARIEEALVANGVIGVSVLSGNRNFEARVHQSVKANFLMSPPLVVAFALAGRIDIDLLTEPLGYDNNGHEVYLRDLWPSNDEIRAVMTETMSPDVFRSLYSDHAARNPLWDEIQSPEGALYDWKPSTYIQEPPFFQNLPRTRSDVTEIRNARALAIFGDSLTTDHISPAGAISPDSPAGRFLAGCGVDPGNFNSYGSRRGNDSIMTRGTFANVRIRNLMAPGTEGGVTRFQPNGEPMAIYDAAMLYKEAGVPLLVFAGEDYGAGSSRDWAAKGTALLGIRAVFARSFERIHRSNLIGMGVLPCQLPDGVSAQSLGLDGSETFDLVGLDGGIEPQQTATLIIRRNTAESTVPVKVRIDTPIEADYFRHGGILLYVLRQLMAQRDTAQPSLTERLLSPPQEYLSPFG